MWSCASLGPQPLCCLLLCPSYLLWTRHTYQPPVSDNIFLLDWLGAAQLGASLTLQAKSLSMTDRRFDCHWADGPSHYELNTTTFQAISLSLCNASWIITSPNIRPHVDFFMGVTSDKIFCNMTAPTSRAKWLSCEIHAVLEDVDSANESILRLPLTRRPHLLSSPHFLRFSFRFHKH